MNAASGKPISAGGGNFENAIYNGTSQKVAFTASHAESVALGARTSIVRVVANQDCHIATGTAPVAAADGTCRFLPKGVIDYIGVRPGDKLSVVQDSAGGNLYITEGA